ncbi:hypothetical protein pdam_00022003 [Pocillopora damicornis]|uniref:ShKT domain-containing protein n=1 Tax=Pocillopora damicornis TaxID=46731 RepID=A0A3M6UJA7_POCDA|nr:hypothetical protein pdam_00022003 [Pocillopora damicornis]
MHCLTIIIAFLVFGECRVLVQETGVETCKDTNEVQCPIWADRGDCETNPHWMKVKCQKSCNTCGCADSNVQCPEWAKLDECFNNPQWMKRNCRFSCEQCQEPQIECAAGSAKGFHNPGNP